MWLTSKNNTHEDKKESDEKHINEIKRIYERVRESGIYEFFWVQTMQ